MSGVPGKPSAGSGDGESLDACCKALNIDIDIDIDRRGTGESGQAARALGWLKLRLEHAPLSLIENVCSLEDGALVRLLVRHAAGPCPRAQRDALTCITNIACGARGHARALEREGAIAALRRCLGSAARSVRTRAAWALSNLAGDGAELRHAVLCAGVLAPLLELLRSEAPPAREYSWLAANLLEQMLDPAVPPVPDQSPPEFRCPITRTVMHEPVCAADGHSYERSAICQWFETRRSSPMTNLECDTAVVPNYALREHIRRRHWCPSKATRVALSPSGGSVAPSDNQHSPGTNTVPDCRSSGQHCAIALPCTQGLPAAMATVVSPRDRSAAKSSACVLQ